MGQVTWLTSVPSTEAHLRLSSAYSLCFVAVNLTPELLSPPHILAAGFQEQALRGSTSCLFPETPAQTLA